MWATTIGNNVDNMGRLYHYVDCNTIWDVLLTVLWKLHATAWCTSRWNLLVVRPPFLHGESLHQQKLFALASVVDCFKYVSNQKVMLDRFSNPSVTSSEDGPSETGTEFESDSEAEVSSSQHAAGMLETANAACSPRLLIILKESWRRVAGVASFHAGRSQGPAVCNTNG